MEQLKEALGYAYDILEEGGVGLVNVPNGRQILEEGLFHQINLEHINYFTPYSLTLLCKNAGFNILSLETDREAVELNIYVKKGSKCIPLDECRKKAREGLEQALSGCRTFAVYGAGAKTVVYSRLLVQDRMQYVFDSDPSKAGRYVAGLRLPVEQATKEKCSKCDAILIFASSYNHEIIALLKDFGYPGKIIYFEGYKVMVSDG